ncbi:MAG: bifunctional (p)ppGpp synthetase/guanosine-3',5'-bis(diphosphate) 3'-pyrophosphohydrolase [Pseudomonadota bacterium]|nr:bifunctional (p)ppGpp synthetase/guanosine-3',5'-bis(diphosphate) 3'-pyrophosphohydrolase [Pseudomonadota bacterium]
MPPLYGGTAERNIVAMMRQMQLVEKVLSYDPSAREDLINKAYVFAMRAHGTQKRASGDPYFSHPVEVAGILTDYHLDTESIVTALLHDTIEDTLATRKEIDDLFGVDIGRLVDGVTKLSKVELRSDKTQQAENFRKLLLAMSDDIRVLIVKLADRLHNMRTIGYLKPDKARRIATETMEIYAPLAERIGMNDVREELQNLSFQVMDPHAYQSINARLDLLRSKAGNLIERMKGALLDTVSKAGVQATVTGREKRPFSVWRKIQRKHISFEQLTDVFAFRIIVDDADACYRALGAIHRRYRMIPDQFDDYISLPKRNDYQSIHTAVIGPERLRIEVQIRSKEMHEKAEYGVAAHWLYKTGDSDKALPDLEKARWLQELLDIMNDASNPDEFLEHTKLNMYADQVFCFTPKGRLIELPQGATPVDFAYAVHTDLGNTCVGAKVNGRLVALHAQLKNGEQVEILTSSEQTPPAIWENFVVTGKAKAAIRRSARSKERIEQVEVGRRLLDTTFSAARRRLVDKSLIEVLPLFRVDNLEELYAGVGSGTIAARDVLGAVHPAEKRTRRRKKDGKHADDGVLSVHGLTPGVAVHYGDCCHPVPGDRIVGISQPGKGIFIHTIDCAALELYQDMPERWLDVAWSGTEADEQQRLAGRIEVEMTNRPGTLSKLSTVIAQQEGNIANLRTVRRTSDFFVLELDIEVRDVRHLADIISAISTEPGFARVERIRG